MRHMRTGHWSQALLQYNRTRSGCATSVIQSLIPPGNILISVRLCYLQCDHQYIPPRWFVSLARSVNIILFLHGSCVATRIYRLYVWGGSPCCVLILIPRKHSNIYGHSFWNMDFEQISVKILTMDCLIWGMGRRSLACWDCGFESRHGHGSLCLVSAVYY